MQNSTIDKINEELLELQFISLAEGVNKELFDKKNLYNGGRPSMRLMCIANALNNSNNSISIN